MAKNYKNATDRQLLDAYEQLMENAHRVPTTGPIRKSFNEILGGIHSEVQRRKLALIKNRGAKK